MVEPKSWLWRGLLPLFDARYYEIALRSTPLQCDDASMRRILCFGTCIGWCIACATIPLHGLVFAAPSTPALQIVPDERPRIAVVEIEGIRDGNLTGRITGDVRVFLAGKQILPSGSGSFRVPADALAYDVRTVEAPAGARFVASKKGKRFYPIGSSQAEGLTVKNRVYFSSEEEARRAGYK